MSKDAIVLTGLKETLDALKKFDKDAVKEFTRTINSELGNAKKDAVGFVKADPPLSRWATQPARNPRTRGGKGWPAWDQSVIKAGIRVSKAERRVRADYTTSAGGLLNISAAGAIYELAGRKNKTGRFISNLEKNDGNASRVIWKSVDKNRARIEKNIFDALEKAKDKLRKNLINRSV
jgi:hypothetical protein